MILIKDEEIISKMKEGGKILAEGLELLSKMVKPGLKTIELDKRFNRFCFSRGVKPTFKGYKAGQNRGFPASICVSVNEEVVHGIPSERILKEGDIVTIDAGVTYKGFITDSAITLAVGSVSKEAEKIISVSKQALYEAISNVQEGARVGDISYAIENVVKANNFKVFKSLAGHGVGKYLHEDPLIPNFGRRGSGELLKAGMTLAIETMISAGSAEIITENDDWTLSSADRSLTAQYEHTVLVTKQGYEILTIA